MTDPPDPPDDEPTAVKTLQALGVHSGTDAGRILLQLARDGQFIDVCCEMPQCYYHRGRRDFAPMSPRTDWSPSADHYPILKSHNGKLSADNVRLAHYRCNQNDYIFRTKINAMLVKRMSLDEIAASLNAQNVPKIHGTNEWTPQRVRQAFLGHRQVRFS